MKSTNKTNSKAAEILTLLEDQGRIDNPESLAKSLDYETDIILNWESEKGPFCKKLLQKIDQAKQKCKSEKKQETLEILKENVMGKLFYLSLKDNKYLVMDDLTRKEIKDQLLQEIEIIESCEHNAIMYLDQLEGNHKHFLNGIISLIY